MSVVQRESIAALADTLLEHARRGDRGQLELHGLNPAVIVLLNRTLDAEGAVAAAEDALTGRTAGLPTGVAHRPAINAQAAINPSVGGVKVSENYPSGGCAHRRLKPGLTVRCKSLVKFGFASGVLSSVAGLFLILNGLNEWSIQSKGATSWSSETSFASLQLRAQGKLKIGIGIGLFALAMAGTADPWLNSELEKNKVPWMDPVTPEPPKPEPQQVKPLTGIKRASTMPVKPPTFKKD